MHSLKANGFVAAVVGASAAERGAEGEGRCREWEVLGLLGASIDASSSS